MNNVRENISNKLYPLQARRGVIGIDLQMEYSRRLFNRIIELSMEYINARISLRK